MSRIYKVDPSASLPIVSVKLFGKHGLVRLRMILDTGAALTHVKTTCIDSLGYSAVDGIESVAMYGASGPAEHGFTLHVDRLAVLGKEFTRPRVIACDMDNLTRDGLDGLLGFDLIRQFNLELRGMKGELVVH